MKGAVGRVEVRVESDRNTQGLQGATEPIHTLSYI